MKPAIFLFAATVLLAGCAVTYFTFDKAREVKVGMTEVEMQKIMGKPYMVSSSADREIWVYSFANGFGSAKSVSFVLTNGIVAEVPKIPATFGGKPKTRIQTATP